MRWPVAMLFAVMVARNAHASDLRPGRVELLCHRTANHDVPENTLESLEEAASLGCDVVEIDVRKTLDGVLVLNHDGYLERLTDGIGQVEQSYYDDLRLRDEGGWMGDRFKEMRIPLLEDALRLARKLDIRLFLDLKDKGIGFDSLQALQREGMLERVRFGGEWDDVKRLYPRANENSPVWVEPGVTPEEVRAHHREGVAVVANFSANDHEMDLAAMKAAVAAGADGINVDYPRLGADAVGRPVERRLAALAAQANAGESPARVQAILSLSRYRGFALDSEFTHWLLDSDNSVSRAAAVALVTARPHPPLPAFADALRSVNADARANAAWALGVLGAPCSMLINLLQDSDPLVRQEALVALAHGPGEVSAAVLLPLLSDPAPAIRGAAALALAKHQPDVAAKAIPEQLRLEVRDMSSLYDAWVGRGKSPLSQTEIDKIVLYYRCQVKEVLAISMLNGPVATRALEEQAFRPGKDFSQMNGILAAFQLWDRIGTDARPAVQALGVSDPTVADDAEWMLVQGGPSVLPEVRQALDSPNPNTRQRAIRIVAWQGDMEALPILRAMQEKAAGDTSQIEWAIEKIKMLHPQL